MKNFNRVMVGTILLFILLILGMQEFFYSVSSKNSGRAYRVEDNRLEMEIKQNGFESVNLSKYRYIKKVTALGKNDDEVAFFEGGNSDYAIRNINGIYYRFDYQIPLTDEFRTIRNAMMIVTTVMLMAVVAVLFYVRIKIVKPFHTIKNMPYELSRGNLSVGLKESKNRFFGRFLWGLDLLREHLEEQRVKELTLQKEKKTLLLSISHDIKTPLSAIKLYSKALIRNLYDSDEKRTEIAVKIGEMADKIEGFVSDIIKASSEDFLNLEVWNREYYLEHLIKEINSFYSEKLALLKIPFRIQNYDNCLLYGDMDRSIEVLQNIIENAIKYGDGNYIDIQISSEEDCRLITVANSGCTFSETELPYIFDSFWRGSNVGNQSGNGLGLYICRQLMLKMDGDIYAECHGDEMRVTAVMRMVSY